MCGSRRESKMRRVILSVLSMSVAALLMAQPALAAKSTVYVTDRVGDTNHLVWNTWPDNSFMAEADYLDATAAWMTLKDEKLTAGIEVVAPIYVEDGLPHGVKTIWYTWYFYVETGPGVYDADYALEVSWDGDTFYSFVAGPYADNQYPVIAYLQNIRVHDNVVEVTLDAGLLPGVTAWFFEVIVLMITPEDEAYLDPTKWYWYFYDVADWDPDETYLPWSPMP